MNPNVSPIVSRLSLRPPQAMSLEVLSRVCDLISLEKGADAALRWRRCVASSRA